MLWLLGMGVCAAFFYKAGEAEGRSGTLYALISIIVWLATNRFVPGGVSLWVCLGGQVVLFVVLMIVNVVRSRFGK